MTSCIGKIPIIKTFITQVHALEVISAMWQFFGTEISHCLGAWATTFQISITSFNEFITERSIKHNNNQLLQPCINHRTLANNKHVDPRISIIGNTTFQ